MPLPSLDEIRDAINSTDISSVPSIVWEYAQGTVSVAQSTSHDIYDSLNRYGAPAFPSVFPSQAPPPPPPPPARSLPTSAYDKASRFISDRPFTTAAATTAVVGGIALVGLGFEGRSRLYYGILGATPPSSGRKLNGGKVETAVRPIKGKDGYRKEAVVILGADATPLGFPLALYLEQKGFIVVCSVSNSSAVDELEGKAKGYLRALIMDPSDPNAVPAFVRSLQAVLTLRFPIRSAGDPYPPSSQHLPTLTSVISCLSLPIPPPTSLTTPNSIPPNLQPSVYTPLSAVTALIPTLKSSRSPTKSVIVLLPAQGSLSIPYHSQLSISTAATTAAFEVLSRELKMDALGKKVNVKLIDVGVVSEKESEGFSFTRDEKKNSAKEVFASVKSSLAGKKMRTGSGVEVLQKKVYKTIIKGNTPLNWWYGGRSSVGSGSWTYTLFAPLLPSPVLTFLLSLSFRSIGPVLIAQQQQQASLASSTNTIRATDSIPSLPVPPKQQPASVASSAARSTGSGYGGSSENGGESRESSDMEDSWVDARRA